LLGRPAARIAAADTDVHFLCVGMTEWRRHCRVAAASSAHHRTYQLFTDDDDDDDCPPNYTTAQHALPLWRSASREHLIWILSFFLFFFLLSFFRSAQEVCLTRTLCITVILSFYRIFLPLMPSVL